MNCSWTPAPSSAATAASPARSPSGITSAEGRERYERMAGTTVFTAQKTVGRCWLRLARWTATPPITHPVKFYEKGDKPLEIVASRQWYIRTVAATSDRRGMKRRTVQTKDSFPR